jgi:hypothetical protein
MENVPPNMAVVCLPSTSVTNSQNASLISAEPSLSTQSTILPSKTSFDETAAFRHLKKISPEPKIPRKCSIEKQNYLFLSLNKLIISRKSERSKEEIKYKIREIRSINSQIRQVYKVRKFRKVGQ